MHTMRPDNNNNKAHICIAQNKRPSAALLRQEILSKPFIVTGPPTHSVEGQTSNGRWRLSSSSVTLHGGAT